MSDVPVKGYLKGAWDMVGAFIRDPKQAWDDINRGDYETRLQEKFMPGHLVLAYGGVGASVSGLINMGSGGLLVGGTLGLAGMLTGFGRYHAMGEAARLQDEQHDMIREEIDKMLKDLEAGLYNPPGNGPIIDTTYRLIDRGPAGGLGEDITLPPPPKGAPPPEAHL